MDLHVVLAQDAGAGPLRDQLEEQVRRGVRDGRLRPGAALPPSRVLARELGVSRGVVVEAYAQLAAEGFLVARRGAGTAVAPRPPAGPEASGRAPAARGRGRARRPTTCARAAPTSRPSRAPRGRRRCARPCGRSPTPASTTATRAAPRRCGPRWPPTSAAPGASPPRRATSSSPRASPRASRWSGRRCASAAPAAWPSRTPAGAVSTARCSTPGLEAVPVPVDADGLDVDALLALDPPVDAVALTPAHQFPTASCWRRAGARRSCGGPRRPAASLVEDDYDADHRYDREPVGALQALAPAHVVHAGSVEQGARPGAAPGLARRCRRRWSPTCAGERDRADHGGAVLGSSRWPTSSTAATLARHLRRTRRRHRDRRDALVAALDERLPGVRVGGVAAGLHVVALAAARARRGRAWRRPPRPAASPSTRSTPTARSPPPRPGALLLGYARLPEPALRRAVALLAAAAADDGPHAAARHN